MISSDWTLGDYSREEGEPSAHWPSAALVADLRHSLDGVPDDATVKVRADVLSSLLAAVERHGLTRVPGVTITDKERGVTYNVTVAGGEGRVWLRTVEVALDDPSQQPDPSTWRLPAQRLADAAALHLAQSAPGSAVVTDERGNVLVEVTDSRPGPPTVEELAALVSAGQTRRTIAARFGRSVATVDGWLAKARAERPDAFPPQRRGPKPRRAT